MLNAARHTLHGLFVALVVVVFTMGIAEARNTASASTCGDDLGEIGTCPPYDNNSCQDDCFQQFGTPNGQCGPTEDGTRCCICMV